MASKPKARKLRALGSGKKMFKVRILNPGSKAPFVATRKTVRVTYGDHDLTDYLKSVHVNASVGDVVTATIEVYPSEILIETPSGEIIETQEDEKP